MGIIIKRNCVNKTSKVSAKLGMGLVAVSLSILSMTAYAQNVVIGALVSGQVSEVFVVEGQSVKSGEKLVNIDSQRFVAKTKFLKSQLKLQEAKLKDAQIELDTALDLFDRTVTARRTLDAAKLAFTSAEAERDKAKAELELHMAWQKYVFIKAPFAAKVVKVHAPQGATVFKENQPIIELEKH